MNGLDIHNAKAQLGQFLETEFKEEINDGQLTLARLQEDLETAAPGSAALGALKEHFEGNQDAYTLGEWTLIQECFEALQAPAADQDTAAVEE